MIGAVTLVLVASAVMRASSAGHAAGIQKAGSASKQRLPTSDIVRREMTAIRELVAANHSLITHRRMPKQAALTFAARITGHVRALRKAIAGNDAKAALSPLLDAIERGARAVAGTGDGLTQIDGIVEIDEALARYQKRFDHPGWKAVREL